jgi:anti-sigma B factor antagonist
MTEQFMIVSGPSVEGTGVLRVEGQLDTTSAPVLIKRCQEIGAARTNLVLNLSQVTFIASSGVGALLSVLEEFKESGLSLRLASLSPAVQSVIELLNLDQFIAIDPTEAQALLALDS